MTQHLYLLSLIIFLPTFGAISLLFFNRKAEEGMRYYALMVTAITFVLTLFLIPAFDTSKSGIQMAVSVPWIQSWNVNY